MHCNSKMEEVNIIAFDHRLDLARCLDDCSE